MYHFMSFMLSEMTQIAIYSKFHEPKQIRFFHFTKKSKLYEWECKGSVDSTHIRSTYATK